MAQFTSQNISDELFNEVKLKKVVSGLEMQLSRQCLPGTHEGLEMQLS